MQRLTRRVRNLDPTNLGQLSMLVSQAVIQLAQVPIYLSHVPSATYGSFLVLTAFPSSIALGDFGLLAASSTRAIALVARGEERQAGLLLRATLTILSALLVVIVLVFVTIAAAVPWHVLGITVGAARAIFSLYTFYAAFALSTSYFEGVLRARGFVGRSWALIAVVRLLEAAAAATALCLTESLVASCVALVSVRGAFLILYASYTTRTVEWYSPRPSCHIRAPLSGLLAPTLGSLSQPVAYALLNQGLLLAVQYSLGPLSVVAVSTIRTALNFLRQVTQACINAALPRLTIASAVADWSELLRLQRRMMWRVAFVTSLAAIGFLSLGSQLLSIWTHGKVAVDFAVLAAFLVSAVSEVVWTSVASLLFASNEHFRYSLASAMLAFLAILAVGTLARGLVDVGVILSLYGLTMVVIVLWSVRTFLRARSVPLRAFIA